MADLTPVDEPLVVTLALDEASQSALDGLRRRHFPADRNVLGAHVTMFHHLPGEALPEVAAELARVASGRGPFGVGVDEVRSLGRGVALGLASGELHEVRDAIAAAFAGRLTRQDEQTWRPHVTVQNKVTAEKARRTLHELRDGFEPWTATAEGLEVWRYLGGPWGHVRRVAFDGGDAAA